MTANAAHGSGLIFSGDGDNTVYVNNSIIQVNAGVSAIAKQGDAGSASEAPLPASLDVAIKAARVAGADDPPPENVCFRNGVWINASASDIVSVFGVDEDTLNTIQKRLEASGYKCIFPVRGQISVPIDSELTVGFECKLPPGLLIESCTKNPLLLNRSLLKKEAHSMYFEPILNTLEDNRSKLCKARYYAYARKKGKTCDEIEAVLVFSWPSTYSDETATGYETCESLGHDPCNEEELSCNPDDILATDAFLENHSTKDELSAQAEFQAPSGFTQCNQSSSTLAGDSMSYYDDEDDDDGGSEELDEDQLVSILVEELIKKGDRLPDEILHNTLMGRIFLWLWLRVKCESEV